MQDETDVLEDKKSELQTEIQLLQQQRDELEFLLATHKASCRRNLNTNVSSAPVSISSPAPVVTSAAAVSVVPVPMVKQEPEEMEDDEFLNVSSFSYMFLSHTVICLK